MLGTMIPLQWFIEAEPRCAEIAFFDQEAAHQLNWEMLAEWCWARNIYLSMPLHKRPKNLEVP